MIGLVVRYNNCLCCLKFAPSDDMDPAISWKPTFVAITDKDFLLYDAAPTCKDEWASPVHSHSILATRFHCCLAEWMSITRLSLD